MAENFNYPIKTLELDKILLKLAQKTACDDAYNQALEIIPCNELSKVNSLLENTHTAYDLQSKFGSPSFGGLTNIKDMLKFSKSGGILSTSDLLHIASALKVFAGIVSWKKQSDDSFSSLDYLFSRIYTNKFLCNKISSSIISTDEISDTASDELFTIRRRIKSVSSRIREKLDKIIHSSTYAQYLQEPIVTIRESRFVVPVKAECRTSFNGLVHGTSASGSTLFVEPIVVLELNNEINVLKSQEKNEISKILQNLSENVAEVSDMIYSSYNTAIQLNIIFAKADLAYEMKATMPIMNNVSKINLKRARHPLINANDVVPIDISLGIDFDTLIITGPNTGGKTVTLKTIGLLTLMAMCGFMIPASDDSKLSVFSQIFCDIGDEQSIEQSLSTFSSHMTNIVKIQQQANFESLILLDELGAGTDPVEGAALAMAILENLKNKNTKIVATTHYAELKAFALNTKRVENACCEFDVQTLKPTYKLIIGIPGKSNAFAISKKLSMPDEIIKRANQLLSYENRTFEDVINNLEKSRQKLDTERSEANKLFISLKKKQEKLDSITQKVQKEQDTKIKYATEKAQRIISMAQANAEDLLNEVETLKKKKHKINSDEITKLKRNLKNIKNQADPIQKRDNKGYVMPRKLELGDSVLIVDLDKKAEVLKLPDSNNEVLVQAGILKIRVSLKNLRLMKKDKVFVSKSKLTKSISDDFKTEIDLRGKTALEATTELDKFIDSALLSGIKNITVIHGKGSGVLRREISTFLKRHKSVKSYRLGNYGEGDSGVTIIEIK